MTTTVPENPNEIVLVENNFALTPQQMNFESLWGMDIAEHLAFRLVEKTALESIPMVILAVTVRDGMNKTIDGAEVPGNYWSFECITASAERLQALFEFHALLSNGEPIASLNQLRVQPNERVVFNDSGTGAAREIAAFLQMRGMIDVGTLDNPNGPMGKSCYDRPPSMWRRGGDRERFVGNPALMKLPMGLRYSEYDNPADPTGKAKARTWYLN